MSASVISYGQLPDRPLSHRRLLAHAPWRAVHQPRRTAMGIFSTIMDKIFHHAKAAQPAGSPAPAPEAGTGTSQQSQAGTSTQPSGSSTTAAQPQLRNVDVNAVLTQLATTKGGGGNWKTSIVDLLKLLDMDSSLTARKTLAQELNVHAGADGSAEQNIALQKAVMQKIAENGGKVPDSLKH
jgi:hypothetical protein